MTSIDVAEDYPNKSHGSVLRAIDNLECPEKFDRLNFAPVTYIDAHGERRRMIKVYRDGFILLTGKFTGKKAARFLPQDRLKMRIQSQ